LLPVTPDEYAWDLSRPLAAGWHVGTRGVEADIPVVRPEWWFDPHHQTEMYQIRSDKQWSRGFIRFHPDSLVRVRYWVDRPGRGQVVFCVRTALPGRSETGVLECNDAFLKARPGAWQWLETTAAAMLDFRTRPRSGRRGRLFADRQHV